MRQGLFAFLLLSLSACQPEAEVVDYCALEPDNCPPCVSDAECRFSGNPCTDTVYCAHVEAAISVVQIGCSEAQERAWPPAETCACRQSACSYRPE